MINFFEKCKEVLLSSDIDFKCNETNILYNSWTSGLFPDLPTSTIESIKSPGAPEKPKLVSPLEVPKRHIGSKEGHAGLFHALAHIEFNAINLAIDACYRFQNMPHEYYANWLSVANDEVYHFRLLNEHLSRLGYTYGDFNAHTGLWDMAIRTENNILHRIALVPRVLEARGLDAIPEIKKKVLKINDHDGAKILDIIHRDEINHVKFGDKWFKYLCDERKLSYQDTFF